MRLRIGESRCHQYSAPAAEKHTCSKAWTPELRSAASYIAGMCQAHMKPGVGEHRERRVGEVAGPALDRRAGGG